MIESIAICLAVFFAVTTLVFLCLWRLKCAEAKRYSEEVEVGARLLRNQRIHDRRAEMQERISGKH